MRLFVGLPIIIMGETGIGKTSLINLMTECIGCKIEIMNCHAGIEENEFLQFIMKY